MNLPMPGGNARIGDGITSANGGANGIQPIPGIRRQVKITPAEIVHFAKYVRDLTGIHIEAAKSYLLETRLGRLLEQEGCDSFTALLQKAKADAGKRLQNQIIDAITTNETLFFRDTSPFELLKFKIIPELIDKRAANKSAASVPLRIWSAACSTGQEVFSIAIVLRELLGNNPKYNIQLLGTDISDAAIKQASSGIYNRFEIERGLPRERLQRYFTVSGDNWKIKDEIRSMATFRKINLLAPFTGMGKFDLIFCRNVAIYFTLEDRMGLFDKIADTLVPDGYLIIGSTESLTGVCPRFIPKRHLKSIFYQLR
ncbi:CheR family methyltransferase [Desulfatitalea alkaliphila]|uniref:protein-glutamate O-methyltransferase n=1 Tax=Desulfatitalea alkaliphila TaxID=2929485 RepID=A0AA41R536_9BACT|nr:protein-glutamate O-methyltransferase CheR [Desulfatitalea alkaliphila]MCJ8501951.1 protein-glutamate O-methyltransferase CheR [Desulfatitalea alkaliphila]